jgi:hypothetical protein
MSAWFVAVTSLGWLAVSAAATTGPLHMLELWAVGMLCAYAALEATARFRRYRHKSHQRDTGPMEPFTGHGSISAYGPVAPPASRDASALGTASETSASDRKRADINPVDEADGRAGAAYSASPEATFSERHAGELPAILTAEEAADLLHVSHEDLLAAMRAGTVPGNQIAGNWRCSVPSLITWLDGNWPSRSP